MNKKTILSTIGVVVLGALGSGLWELVKPLLGSLWSATLTLSTLGLDSLRDGMYAQAAAALGRPVGVGLAVQLLTAVIFFATGVIIHALESSFPGPASRGARLYSGLCLALSIALLVAGSRTAYILQLSNFHEKLEVIAAPYLSDAERKQYRAMLAKVHGRAGYLELVESLSTRIERAGEKPPSREFF